MEQSILLSTKKILGVGTDDASFDLDIMTHINSELSILHNLGIGPPNGVYIEDAETEWDDLLPISDHQLHLIKTCVYLRSRLLFDPPATSYLLGALQKQLEEHEVRLNLMREETEWVDPDPPVVEEEV